MSCLDLKKKLGLKIIKIYKAFHLELKMETNFGLEEVYLESKLILLKMSLMRIIMFTETLSLNL
jgi:hypothetical protein